LLAAMLICAAPFAIQAQQRDSARAGVAPQQSQAPPKPDTTPKPPMTPRRAFLASLILPGYAQTVFGRERAAMLFAIVEVASIGMARKSAQDLAEARAFPFDSVVTSYKIDPATGLATIDPKTGLPVPATFLANRFTPDLVKARKTHYEDWIAALIFNHLISGADAYVAANLWDFNANMGAVSSGRSLSVYASLRFR
jgi:hypothetical protein